MFPEFIKTVLLWFPINMVISKWKTNISDSRKYLPVFRTIYRQLIHVTHDFLKFKSTLDNSS